MRFPEFSGEWNKYTINDLATVVGGGTPDTTVKSYWGGDIQWFTPSEIGKNKYVDFSKRTITRDGLDNSSAKLLPLHTILLNYTLEPPMPKSSLIHFGSNDFPCIGHTYLALLYR